MKLYCFYTPSHKKLYDEWLLPTASKEYVVIPEEHNQLTNCGKYSEYRWAETQHAKISFWINAIESNLGDVIVCSDVDIQFFGATKHYLIDLLGSKDICFQQNDSDKSICSGFFICRCSRNTLDFFNIILNRINKKFNSTASGEQVEINKLLQEKWYKNLNWSLLPRNKFWNAGMPYFSLDDLRVPKYLLMHHANWCSGIDEKIKQLEHVNWHRSKNLDFWKPTSFKQYQSKVKNITIGVCLSSLLRSFDIASTSLIVRVLNSLPVKPDLIGHFPSQCRNLKNLKTLNRLKPFFNNVHINFDRDPELDPEELSMHENMTDQPNGIKGNLLQWLSMKSCAEMVESIEDSCGKKYDWLIWSRPDLYFFNSLENLSSLDPNKIYIPCHDNHLNGVNDRFSLGGSDAVKQRMHIYDYFVKEWYPNYSGNVDYLTWSKNKNQYVWNPEIVLKQYLKDLRLHPFSLNLCFGKLRNNFFATCPFWHSIHGSDKNNSFSERDVVNYEVLNKLNQFDRFQIMPDSDWHAVNVLQDSSLLYHHNPTQPIESKMANKTFNKKNIFNKIISKIVPKIHQ